MKLDILELDERSADMALNAARLIKSIERNMTKLYGHVNHNTRDRRAIDRRVAYYKCLCDTGMFTIREICLIVHYGLGTNIPQHHASVIHSRKTAERFISIKDPRFIPVYSDIKRQIDKAAEDGFSKPKITELEMQFIDENFLP